MWVVLSIIAGLLSMWFLIIWLPHRIHLVRLGIKYGWPSQKRIAIKKLLLEGVITGIGYLGASFDPDEEFILVIAGSFGTYVRRGKGIYTEVDPMSATLPPEVIYAFNGYLDRMDDVVWLLWNLPFLDQLRSTSSGRFRIKDDTPQLLSVIAS